ncbi:hypothetical protein [Streptomyces sp. NPDC005953]
MTGPPPCLWSDPCGYDDDTNTCLCDDEPDPDDDEFVRPITDVPTGTYL